MAEFLSGCFADSGAGGIDCIKGMMKSEDHQVTCVAHCQKTWFEPKVLGFSARQRPKVHIQLHNTRLVAKEKMSKMSPELNPFENLWRELKSAIG